jgi:hypothetical protein
MLAAIDWSRLLDPPLGPIICGAIAGAVNFSVIGYCWIRSREIRLKQRMVERGYSADEIERIARVDMTGRTHHAGQATPPAPDTGTA